MTWPARMLAIEGALRGGRVAEAARALKTSPRVPRAFAATFAQAARRAGLDQLSLRALNRYVRSDQRVAPANAREVVEYAAGLLKIGASREARDLLSEPRVAAEPLAHLYRAFADFHVWDYAAAVPHLERYLSEDLASYARRLGELNLAAALVTAGDHARAAETLVRLKAHADRDGLLRILTNAREVTAQLALARGDFVHARAELESIVGAEGRDALWVAKWTAVLDAEAHRDFAPLARVRRRAWAAREWESVRDVDFHHLRLQFSDELAQHLVFGTPHAAYRRRVLARVSRPLAEAWRYGTPHAPTLDLATGEVSGLDVAKPTNGVHRVLAALMRDLYRPARIGDLFDAVFTGEYYDPRSSPNRVHQALARARAWAARGGLPLEISEDHGAFRLRLTGPFALALTRGQDSFTPLDVQLNLVRATFGARWFSPGEARAALGASASALKRTVAAGLADGRLERTGAGRAILYKLCG